MLLVRFKTTNRTRCFNFSIRESNDLKLYDDIIIKIMGKDKLAKIVFLDDKLDPNLPVLNSNCIIKLKTKEKEALKKHSSKKKSLVNIFVKKAIKHNLKLKLVDVKYNVVKKSFTFLLKSTNKDLDLTNLKKELSYTLKSKVEIKVLSARDEARKICGYGPCGRGLCCSLFLQRLKPVSIKTVKDQNMPLNPARISGACGKLLCCLNYEEENYKERNNMKLKIDPSIFLEKCDQREIETEKNNIPNYY